MCAVIIGAGTSVSIPTLFPNGGFVSINFGVQPQVTRLWQLGSYSPYTTYVLKQRTFSLVAYGKKDGGIGGSNQIDVTPSTSCVNPNPIAITVTPTSCGYTITPFSGDYYPTSYSYSKDNFGWGQESWSFVTEPILDIPYGGTILFLRGIATGQVATGAGFMTESECGIQYDAAASQDYNGNWIDGEAGSVQAGFPGIGDYTVQREYVVTAVGGSLGKKDGYKGNASVSIPMQTVYV